MLNDKTTEFIKKFARDHLIVLSGTDVKTRGSEEHATGVDWWHGGFQSRSHDVETVTFHPDHFSFNYKGVTISGPLSGVKAETQVLVDGEEADCDQDDIEAAVEKACGFPLDPCEFEEPEIEF